MRLSHQRFWTVKDLARILELSEDTVRRNETRLGLDKARINLNARVIRYRTSIAIRELEQLEADLKPYPEGATLSRHILKHA